MGVVTINGNTWTTQTMPVTPAAPATLEIQQNAIVAATTNPFSGQQQVFNWNVAYKEISASYPTMTNSTAQSWVTFFESLQGQLCVFSFPTAVCASYPLELTIDGFSPRYFRLKDNAVKWAVAPGGIYTGVSFEAREVL